MKFLFFTFIFAILFICYYKEVVSVLLFNGHNNNKNSDEDDFEKCDNSQKQFLENFYKQLSRKYNRKRKKIKEKTNKLFPIVEDDTDSDDDDDDTLIRAKKLRLNNRNIYDVETGNLLLATKGHLRLYPKADNIPHTCGFGKLYYSQKHQDWLCQCNAPDYFGGKFCDELQPKLTIENKCLKVAFIDNLNNSDVATFNPFLRGVCVECSDKNATPILSSYFPKCDIINKIDEELLSVRKNNICFSDPMNSNFNSAFNEYIPGYGCKCDYYNGFVEVFVPNSGRKEEEDPTIVSNCCIKIGKTNNVLKSHLAYYTLNNHKKPIQVHEYEELEEPFNLSLASSSSTTNYLIKQEAKDIVHKQDWLNRCIKPTSRQKLLRINYPRVKWPRVNKKAFVNYYGESDTTAPLSAYRLAVGRGFETKHWYETTNQRFINNAILGRPIVFGYNAPVKKWNRTVTLNPLGPLGKHYYGLTMLYKPGETIRLDIRGYESEKEKNTAIVTLAPDYTEEMMDKSQYIYIAGLYVTYNVRD